MQGVWFDAKELENFSKNNPLEPKKDYSDSREAMRAFLMAPTPMEKEVRRGGPLGFNIYNHVSIE